MRSEECRVCGGNSELRAGVCFDCAGFESLIDEKVDMFERPIEKKIDGSDSLNILYKIIKHYKDKK